MTKNPRNKTIPAFSADISQELAKPARYGQAQKFHDYMAKAGLKGKALRYNEGKPKLSFLLSAPHAIHGLAKVMEYGSLKYSRDNWLKGLPMTEVMDSMLRHIVSFNSGEDADPESGLPHVDHILCNALFLSEFFYVNPGTDDRKEVSE